MSYLIKNDTNTPVHIRVLNAGITYYHCNFLAPGESWTCVPEKVWYDISVIYATEENKFKKEDNDGPVWEIGATVVGILGIILGIVLSAGTATPLLLPAAVSGIAGVIMTVGGVSFAIANNAILPAVLHEMYGANDYDLHVTGGLIIEVDKKTNTFKVTGARPIGMTWTNKTSGSSGSTTGAILPRPATAQQKALAAAGGALVAAGAVVAPGAAAHRVSEGFISVVTAGHGKRA